MAIKPGFSHTDIEKAMLRRLERIDRAIVFRLSRLGEECVNNAREFGSYIDRTGNLRNSVGYLLLKDGSVLRQNFKRTAGGGEEGTAVGQNLAHQIAMAYPAGYVLIVVAGMDYAAYVEARNRNVLATAEQFAREKAPQIIRELKTKVGKMK
ncbi:MAG TPA: hypothetical protein P5531_03985 [Bacteroidales bacterium]|nr:hypothetical protein [Bacteroidales bacterium]